MKKMKNLKPARRVLGALFTLALPTVLLAAPLMAQGKVAVDVNGEKIYVADVERVVSMIKDSEKTLQTGSEAAKKSLQDLRDSITENFIVQKLLVQEAKRQKIVIKDEDVEKGFKAFKEGYGDDEAFKKAISAEGKSPAEVRRTLQEELMLRELTSRMTADIQVTDADVRAFYVSHPAEFKVPEAVRARHILIAYPENASDIQKKAARAKAEDLLKKAMAKGADFSKLARENTDDLGTKDTGGDLDFAIRGTFLEPFEKAVFGAPLGVIPRVVETDYGYHVIRIEQKEVERMAKFEEIKDDPQLRLDLRQDKIKKRIDDKIEALRKAAKITKY